MRLEGKKAFITAAGQGIGRAIAERFVTEGADVVATDLNADLMAGINGAKTFALDVLDTGAVKAAIAEAAPEILVNCAGFVHAGTIEDATDEEFDFAHNLNVRAMMHTIKAALPAMKASGRGSIINISSVASSVQGLPNRFIYGTSKAGVVGLTKSVAIDVINHGIRCNCICPGTVDSPSLHDRLRATGNYEQAMKDFIARQPMGRIGTAEEIASLVVYLASDAAGFITGATMNANGGTLMG